MPSNGEDVKIIGVTPKKVEAQTPLPNRGPVPNNNNNNNQRTPNNNPQQVNNNNNNRQAPNSAGNNMRSNSQNQLNRSNPNLANGTF